MTLTGPVVFYPSCASTQIEAKRELSGVHWTTEQTAGKGRFERQWHAEPGQSLAVSICFPEYVGFDKPYLIAMWISLGLAAEFDLRVQWPNDLTLNGKKVCGVLTEIIDGVPVIGFGINVGPMSFPSELAHRASSLANEGRDEGNLTEVLDRFLQMIRDLPPVPQDWKGMDAQWRKYDETPGKVFKLQDGRVGIAEGVSADGELVWNSQGDYDMVTCADALWGINSVK